MSKVGRLLLPEVAGNEDDCSSLKIARAVIVSEAIASSSSEQFAIRWADIGFSWLACWCCYCLISFVDLVLPDTRLCVEYTNIR